MRKATIIFYLAILFTLLTGTSWAQSLTDFPKVSGSKAKGYFPIVNSKGVASVVYDDNDFDVVKVASDMLKTDIKNVTGQTAEIPNGHTIVIGTVGKCKIIDNLASQGLINVADISDKWESFAISTIKDPKTKKPMLVIAGSDGRGTAYGAMTLCRKIGVSPWTWWADVTPKHKDEIYIQSGTFIQDEPSVKYRGIFINDERFGGWAQWVEQNFDKESGKVGPKVYEKVFELLLRLKANYLWPAMHPGTQAFNADPANARLANKYGIVMGSSHCEQMLRNNEGEWKAVGTYGDFNFVTNRETMLNYWEERIRTNGKFENTYTLGLRGIHDYPMEGANSTEQRVALMQQAIDAQREILSRNISKPIDEIPQILCTYEEVLDAYHSGLKVPDDVILLWSDDKQGYTRNLCNPQEMKRKGGSGIYYHLSYHGDPASWIWLSPLSPAFISNEMCKAYQYGARKVWVFNVGDIKPAEKEISFAMDLAWDVEKWKPENAHKYIEHWASETFGSEYAKDIAEIMSGYYRLMASGKDSHIWFVEYTENEHFGRVEDWREIADRAEKIYKKISDKNAFFELVLYPVKGAYLLNAYQLLAKGTFIKASKGELDNSLADKTLEAYNDLNQLTEKYHKEILNGKWDKFFNWIPYHWYYEKEMPAPVCDSKNTKASEVRKMINTQEAMNGTEIISDSEGYTDLWIRARTPVRNFSKAKADNEFCTVEFGDTSFTASATPINNVWHSPYIGPMWSNVGKVRISKGVNKLRITNVKPDARIDSVFLGVYPPLPAEPLQRIPAKKFNNHHNADGASIAVIPQLGFNDGVMAMPVTAPSYEVATAPYVEYQLVVPNCAKSVEVRTLPTLHIYEGRDARFAIQIDGNEPQVFSIHEGDFTSEWRLNVLRGYATRSVSLSGVSDDTHTIRIYLLDPGIVLQEILIH